MIGALLLIAMVALFAQQLHQMKCPFWLEVLLAIVVVGGAWVSFNIVPKLALG